MAHDFRFPLVESPNAHWAGIRFGEVGELNTPVGRSAWSGYPDLRMDRLPDGDEEIRIWGGYVLAPLQGVFLLKKGGIWSAVRLLSSPPLTPRYLLAKAYEAPVGGWSAFWERAEALGIWDLPDDSTLPQKGRGVCLDGSSYTVEIQRDSCYRAYHYGNPAWQRQWPEANRMQEIVELLDDEFPLPAS